jgi:flagellar hook-basal body complex protein FliE
MRVPSATELQALLPTEGTIGSPHTTTPADAGFGGILVRTVEEANAAEHAASQKIDALASGASDDLHGTMISAKEAEISVKLVGSIRNKLLDAFHEIWRTSV